MMTISFFTTNCKEGISWVSIDSFCFSVFLENRLFKVKNEVLPCACKEFENLNMAM